MPVLKEIDFVTNGNVSYCIWVKLHSYETDIASFVAYGFNAENLFGMNFHSTTSLHFYFWDNIFSLNIDMHPGRWVHYCASSSRNGHVEIFVNGVSAANFSNEHVEPSTTSKIMAALGNDIDDGKIDDIKQGFVGEIAGFHLTNETLSSSEAKKAFYNVISTVKWIVRWNDFKAAANALETDDVKLVTNIFK